MEYIKFGELYAIPSSNGVSRPTAVRGNGFHMISMGELFSHDIINEMEMDRVKLSENEQERFLVAKNDLLFARQSLVAAGAGKCSVVNNLREETTFESHLIRIRLKSICNARYYFYFFQLPYNPIKAIVNQCAQAGIRGKELARIKVPFPPKHIQDNIASILSAYDELIENNTKRIRLLEQMAENLYKECFVRFRFPGHEKVEMKNGLPKGWKIVRINDIAHDVGIGISKEDVDIAKDVYIPIDSIPNHQMAMDAFGDIEDAQSSLQRFAEGDILFGAMRVYFHKVIIAPAAGVTRSTCFVINSRDPIAFNYLYLLLYQDSTIAYANTISVGATMPYVRWNDFVRMHCILPDNEILEKFNNYVNPIMKRLSYALNLKQTLARQRDLLLPRLMSGKLEVKV